MKRTKKVVLFTIGCVVVLAAAGLVGALLSFGNTARTLAATPQTPTLGSSGELPPCTANIVVTNLQSQSLSLGAARRITVNWIYASVCCGLPVEKFNVNFEITRNSGSKHTSFFDAPASERALSRDFGNLGDPIKSVTATVSAFVLRPHAHPGSRTVTVGQ